MSNSDHQQRRGHLIQLIQRRLGSGVLVAAEPNPVEDRVVVSRERFVTVLAFCRNDPDADLDALVDLTVIDHKSDEESALGGRYEILARLRSTRLGYRLRLSVPLPESDPVVPTACGIYPAADWLEREAYDMFGIVPDGHAYVRRLLMYPGFAGHPLRRGYPQTKFQPLIPLRMPGLPPDIIDDETDAVTEGGDA